jgi:hypothetical protein
VTATKKGNKKKDNEKTGPPYTNALSGMYDPDEEAKFYKVKPNTCKQTVTQCKEYAKILRSYYPEDVITGVSGLTGILNQIREGDRTILLNVEGSRMITYQRDNKLRLIIGIPYSLSKDITTIEEKSSEKINKFAMFFYRGLDDKIGIMLVPEHNYRLLTIEAKRNLLENKTLSTFVCYDSRKAELDFPLSEHNGKFAKFLANNDPFVLLSPQNNVSKYRIHIFEDVTF